MFRFFVVVACAVALSSAGIAKHYNVVLDHGFGGAFGGHGGYDDGKDTHGAELSSLAHSSAIQAKNAVQNQHTAGSHAAYGIKSSLASAALGAAQTAQAALVGKHAIVGNLKQQLSEAQKQLEGELALHQQTENAAHSAQAAAQQAQNQLNTITAALATAQAGVQHAQHAAVEAANSASVQQNMVAEAKQRVAHVLGQLQHASADLQETEVSASKAAEAAHIAKSNAAAAGAEVTAAGAKGGYSGHHY
ncbi:uncharacterized protein LOC108912128 [Anoplophora glabripennis]|uniref:uncharacterized protein LOC108912128 n=1 Tax=Anoplophora glabripennis TaxID=217634 RepID=UPI000873CA2B|nr:uncharacterized protein LOC108912128 [Anoplophora glabripennis]